MEFKDKPTKHHQILVPENTIHLSEREATKVFQLIEQPPLPTADLITAMKQHRDFFKIEQTEFFDS